MKNQEEKWLLDEKYGGVESPEFFDDCKRLAAGEPLGYIIGHVPFLGCTIHLDNHPLIPRPETEFWVEKAIAAIKSVAPTAPRILDLCAGSGAIGIAVAKAIPDAIVDFAELDRDLLPTVAKNLETNDISCTHYRVWLSDLFNGLPKLSSETKNDPALGDIQGTGGFSKEPYQAYGEEKIGTRNAEDRQSRVILYDFILSNPPYIDPILDRTETSVKYFEPHLALYGGEAGLDIISQIIKEAPAYLNPHGQLWLEHEPEQTPTIKALAEKHGFAATTHKDQYNQERYSILVLQ